MVSGVSAAFVTVCLFFMHRLHGRLDRLENQLGDVRVESARHQQENKELHTHIHRIDKNLDDLFKKMEEILLAVRKNGQK